MMADMKNENPHTSHNLIMENRKKLTVSGVKDVTTFETDQVQLKTVMGDLNIRGSEMRLESFTAETGELMMQGNVYALVYVNDTGAKEGIFRRIFK